MRPDHELTTGRPPLPRGRDATLDVARGLGIVLIVVGHVLRGLAGADVVDPGNWWYDEVDTAFYLVHLPVFLVVSGALLPASVARRGTSLWLRRRVTLLMWLFAVWTLIEGLVRVAIGSLANTPATLTGLLDELVRPTTVMWFLPSLAVLSVVVVLLRPWASPQRGLVVALAGSVAVLPWWGHFGVWAGTQGIAIGVFLLAGAALGLPRLTELLARPQAPAAGAAAALLFLLLCWVTDPAAPSESYWPVTVASVLAGVAGTWLGVVWLLVLARVLARIAAGVRPLDLLGRRSLEIYLAHIIFTAGARVALSLAGVGAPLAHLCVGVAAGLAGPLLLVAAADRLGMTWLFNAPPALLGSRP